MTKVRNSDYLRAFGKNLKVLREKCGLSQEELSFRADIPFSQIGRIERGEINTTISTVYVLASALEIPESTLFEFEFTSKNETK